MPDPIIIAENIGKRYLLSHQATGGGGYKRFSEVIVDAAKRFVRPGSKASQRDTVEDFWALKDVSFEINQGDVVGIIGRNGAGKSTLLKILSRITEPTQGRITLKGRVASLLEVGTGFHPELTGRENIYLNGAILGMRKNEIKSKFDEIVAFAEIEKFLDTPVKRYSSGMYVRLAFAVAAHLEPEILIVDEVLAVGDAQFQAKCLGKMQDVARGGGRTVLFVSHNMAAVNVLCTKACIMHRGEMIGQGPTRQIVEQYLDGGGGENHIHRGSQNDVRSGIELIEVRLTRADKSPISTLTPDEGFNVDFTVQLHRAHRGVRVGYRIESVDGTVICGANSSAVGDSLHLERGRYQISCFNAPFRLNSGSYVITIGIDIPPYHPPVFLETNCLRFSVEDVEGVGPNYVRPPGIMKPVTHWSYPATL